MEINLLIGITGLSLILAAFFLNLINRLNASSVSYLALNIIGSSFLAYYAIAIRNIPFLILQSIWFLLSLYKLIAILFKK